MLARIRNNPNLAGAVLAALAFIATMLIAPAVQAASREAISSEIVPGLALALAALAFYKGRRAVQKRLGGE